MDTVESKMVNLLLELKENYHICSIKSEFEAEGATFEEVLFIKKIADNAGLDFTLKLGGCEALRDMFDAKNIGVNAIVAPMIESVYALNKYVRTINKVFSKSEQEDIKFFINIETKTGFDNVDEILSSKDADKISGIVLGRTDFIGSLGLNPNDINNNKIYEYAEKLALKSLKYGKEFIIGGGVTSNSFSFFNKLMKYSLSKFETQKVIFNAEILNSDKAKEALLKAFEFELMWIKNKEVLNGKLSEEDKNRIKILETRYNESFLVQNVL